MRVIGLTGLVGSGKSGIADYLEATYNACILKTDLIAAELQMKGNECYDSLVDLLGTGCLRDDGELDRGKVADVIFDKENLTLLSDVNGIVHNAVIKYVKKQVDFLKNDPKNTCNFLVIESALLFDSGLNNLCDECWYVYVSYENRLDRLNRSRGYSKEKTDSILKNQLSDFEMRGLCDIIIDNDGDFFDTLAAVDDLLPEGKRQ